MITTNQEQKQETEKKEAEVAQSNVNIQEKNISQEKVEAKQTENKESEHQEDPNWRAFREARKKDRAEREAAERKAAEKEAEVAALKAAMEAAFSKSAPTPQAYQQYYGINSEPEETEDQRIEKKLNQLLSQREQQYFKEQTEREQREYPSRLSKDHPDFHIVCSQENLDYLDFHFPEISRPFQRLPEGYDKWNDIYHAIKKLIPNHSTARRDAARVEENSNKPRSISTTSPSHTGERVPETWQDSEKRRAENWARMQRIMKGIG